MTVRFEHLPVVFMRLPRVTAREQQDQDFRLRAWACITVGLLAFWYGLAAWVFSL